MFRSASWRASTAVLLWLLSCHARADIGLEEELRTAGDVPTEASVQHEPVSGSLRARLVDARRLLAAGDFEAAERVLDEASSKAEGPAELEAVERAMAQIDFRRGRYAQAIARHQSLLRGASERGDLAAVAQAELDIGLLERRQGSLNEAIGGFERALSLFRQLEDRDGVASVLTHIGLIRLNQGEYSTALESLRESQRLQAEGAKAELDRTLHYLGLLYAGLREYETSRKFLEQGLAEARRQADAAREAPLLGSMAKISNLRGTHSEALGLARDSLRLVERLDSPPGRAYARLEEGRALLGLDRLDEARETLEIGAGIAERIEQFGTLADFRSLLAEIARRQGREEDALALWEMALPMYKRGHDQPQLLTSYRSMMPVLRARGMHDRAMDIAEESLRLQEQISGLNMNRRLAVLESQHRTEAAEREIEILKRDNEIKALRLRDEETRQWRGLLVIATLGLAALLLAWRYVESRRFGRRLARTNSELVASREDLAQAHHELEKRADLLARAASTDPLTGVANRREFTQRLAAQFEDARARRTPLTMLVVDVDHFKQFNDAYGHAVGDEVLCSIARTLQSSVRSGTLIARWGGEEFVILLPGADLAVGARLAERVREAVAAIRREGIDRVTVSIGVAGTEGRELSRPEDLFEEADAALYRAKESGRDQVVLASSWNSMPGTNRTH